MRATSRIAACSPRYRATAASSSGSASRRPMCASRPGGRFWVTKKAATDRSLRPRFRGVRGVALIAGTKKEILMKKALFSALTLALLYGCASTPVEESKPAEPSATPGLPAAPPLAGRPVQPSAPQGDALPDRSKRSRSEEHTSELQSHVNL